MSEENELTASQQAMSDLWEKHTRSEFETSSVEESMGTMTEDPHVNHVPVMTGGVGRDEVEKFYSEHFIPKQAPDAGIYLVSRTIGDERLVDELIFGFTHTVEVEWMLPGVPPSGKRVEVPMAVVVGFQDGKISSEHIYWDQASVLAQVDLLDPETLPITGVEATRKVMDPASAPSNALISRARRSKVSGV